MKRTILLIIALLTIHTVSSQTLCDTRRGIYSALEHPPKPNLTENELEIALNNTIDPTLIENYHSDYLYIIFYVNCKGEDFNYWLAKRQDGKVQKDSLSSFQQEFLSKIQSLLSWSPGTLPIIEKGKLIEKAVDFQGSYTIRVDGNKFHILNEKEKQKYYNHKHRK